MVNTLNTTLNADKGYTGPPTSPESIRSAEAELGYRLPGSYVSLLLRVNGGMLTNRCIAMSRPTSWAQDHIEVSGLVGILDGEKRLNGILGNEYLINEWDYPKIGIVIGIMPSPELALMLDYTACGPDGEPSVAFIDDDRSVTQIAANFDAFLASLQPCSKFLP